MPRQEPELAIVHASPSSSCKRRHSAAPRHTTKVVKIITTRFPRSTKHCGAPARMLERGDDPLYVARRLVRFASEDVGLADPRALQIAMSAQQAVHFIGLPEGALALAELVVYLAMAPKSNAIYRAYSAAREDV